MNNLTINFTSLFWTTTSSSVVNHLDECTRPIGSCKPGIILPVWTPLKNISTGETVGRAFVYALSLIFIFCGVNIVADKFMEAIEVITSQEREIKVKDKNGTKKTVMVRYWNETVSNLTLMALGSSAPEILLSVIEMIGDNFEAGELGPNVIVGSAAYNLFVIIGYCVMVVPKGETRKIEKLRVFFVTSSWMLFAYVWLCLIIIVISPGVIDLWEAILTCLFFPLTVFNAYLVDKKMYVNARKLIGGKLKLKKNKVREARSSALRKESNDAQTLVVYNDIVQTISFDPINYTCFECAGALEIYVTRTGGDLNKTVLVDYKTEDDTAEAESDYEHTEGTLVFSPNVTKLNFNINIVEDDIYEGDEKFKIKLLNVRYENGSTDENLKITNQADMAIVQILDDDHGGVFVFEEPIIQVIESIGTVRIKVLRTVGAKGKVKIPYRTIDSTAVGGKDFKKKNDFVVFYNKETEKYIDIEIVDHEDYQRDQSFFVELEDPIIEITDRTKLLYDEPGKPRLGEINKIEIKVRENSFIKNIIDKFFVSNDSKLNTYALLWKKQVLDAFKVLPDDEDQDDEITEGKENTDNESSEPKKPKLADYFFHCLYFFWKLLFSIIPPPEIWKGYPCFFVSLIMIGVLTAFVGDLATHFGCTIGLKDSITAISFVALGTSAPDTFASKIAAIHDKHADNSVGNVTGSNGVNVFVGIGIAWLLATIYHTSKGTQFLVKPGSLGFSVTIFSIFAFVCLVILLIRRHPKVGGELGGPIKFRILTTIAFFSLWILYVVLSALEAYCIIKGY